MRFQDLLEAEVSALIVAQRHEHCPHERATHPQPLQRLLATQVGDLTLAIARLRKRIFFPQGSGARALATLQTPSPTLLFGGFSRSERA